MKKIYKAIVVSIITTLARIILWRYRPRVVGITGNVGKTSTKDAVATVLGHFYNVRGNKKSLNSETGVPLTIIGAESGWSNPVRWLLIILKGAWVAFGYVRYPKWLVLEVGADHPGDIRDITQWLKPDIMIGTQMSKVPVHVEFFDSPEDVLREKRYLAEAVRSYGTLVLNRDDEGIFGFKEQVKRRTVTYGTDEHADVRGTNGQIAYENDVPVGYAFKIEDGHHAIPLVVHGTIGKHMIYPALAAIATGYAEGLNTVEMVEAFSDFTPPPGRMRIIQGIKGSTIIDDSYNASPLAVKRGLESLDEVTCTGKRIAVLGDMRELGDYTDEAHRRIGTRAGRVCDVVIAVGENRKTLAQAARDAGCDERNVYEHVNAHDAGKELEYILEKGDVVFIKGSQSVRLERAVEEVMAEPERASELLCRQEKEWKGR